MYLWDNNRNEYVFRIQSDENSIFLEIAFCSKFVFGGHNNSLNATSS
jgi:hypothetical protein